MDNFENTNHLVLNFYPDGYSLAFKLNEFPVFTSETILETAKISYEEMSLLDYIENEELPPLLVEMIDASPKLSQYKIWHNGCLILEIRDKISYRNSRKQTNSVNGNGNGNSNGFGNGNGNKNANSNGNRNAYEYVKNKLIGNGNGTNGGFHDSNENDTEEASYFILLKPSNLSMINDVKNLTDSETWSTRERLQLESKIILHSSPPLHLDPVREEDKKSQLERVNDWPYKRPTNAFTRLKKKLPYPKLSNFRECSQSDNSNPTQRPSLQKDQANYIVDNLPPELNLQHFLATKRAAKKQSTSQVPRFHRFLKTHSKAPHKF